MTAFKILSPAEIVLGAVNETPGIDWIWRSGTITRVWYLRESNARLDQK
jgi:hypothetical protein